MLRQTIMAAIALSLSACSLIYQQPITQGNVLTPSETQTIRPGMSVARVVRTIGYPVLTNIYPENRLVYVYSIKKGGSALQTKKLTLTFVNRRVTRIERS